jgi:hypothetical protein
VASQGTVHGNNVDRGVYKSTDGGLTWKKTLYINDSTGISSLSMDMNNPRVLYAASWEHRRLPWSVRSGGDGCAVWKSVDGGETWKKIMKGLPSPLGKIGVSVSRANSNRVYAIVESEKSKAGVYRSDDAGKSWKLMTNDQTLTARSWYYMEIYADPSNPEIVYDQENWNLFSYYQQMDSRDLIGFWLTYNKHLISLIENMPKESLSRTCLIAGSLFTLQYLVDDYVVHLEHHLKQITSY